MAESTVVTKLINRDDVITDLVNVIAPIYFPNVTLDSQRIGIYGYLTEALAKSIEDTYILEHRRSSDYSPELSSNEIKIMQTAKIRGVDVNRATPASCFASLALLKSDILAKGVTVANTTTFTIDRRSEIIYSDVSFSLEDDIVITAIFRNNEYLFSASYSGVYANAGAYIQMFEQTNDNGESVLGIIIELHQFKYNMMEQTVTDSIEFLFDGLYFDYDNLLSGFEVYYKLTSTGDYIKSEVDQYLTTSTDKVLYYNDDEAGLLRILNNSQMGISTNSSILVYIKESLGEDGNMSIGATNIGTISLYKDSAYNYSGVNIGICILTDITGGSDGDSLVELKLAMIDAKTRRDNVTTDHDIINYVNDFDANLQVMKKRNDIQDRLYNIYTLVRYGENHIAPATTKTLIISGLSGDTIGDFDTYQVELDRKIIRAYSKFKLNVSEGYPDTDTVSKVSIDDDLDSEFYLTCPYMMMINSQNILTYYYTSVNTDIIITGVATGTAYPFQAICRTINIYRNAHASVDSDMYTFSISATLNTSNDDIILDEDGVLLSNDIIQAHLIFNLNDSPVAFMPMNIASYDADTREIIFKGTIRTTDFISEDGKLEVFDGLYTKGSGVAYTSTIDYTDALFGINFMYTLTEDDTDEYPETDDIYAILPDEYKAGRVHMSAYANGKDSKYSLITDFTKFSRSTVEVEVDKDTGDYTFIISEVPFFEFEFGIANTAELYETFVKMFNTYSTLIEQTTDFEVALKFIATYGASKYITVTGGSMSDEKTEDLNDLSPNLYFKIHGNSVDLSEIRHFIYESMRESYIVGSSLYMSNICSSVEKSFTSVSSITYMGINEFDASYQELTYNTPSFLSLDEILAYVPEQFNITEDNIILSLSET